MQSVFEDAACAKRAMAIGKQYYDGLLKPKGWDLKFKDDSSFWLEMKGKDKDGNLKVNGKVRVGIEVYPKDKAEINKVGEARTDPNQSPYLPPPIGRISFSLNPFKMLVSFLSL